jgi:L-fucose isomerase-like protein
VKKLVLVAFRSSLNEKFPIEDGHGELLAGLRRKFELEMCAPGEEEGREGFVLAFIASGGSERAFIEYWERLPRPILLLTDGNANSLAASLEILAWLGEKGMRAEILHGEPEGLCARIEEAMEWAEIRRGMAFARIGLVGRPSEWLVASSVDPVAVRSRWGTEFLDVDYGEFDALIDEADGNEARKVAEGFASEAASIREPGAGDILAAARVYLALGKLVRERGLDALSLRCFDLLGSRKTTGCLALALLNQEGIVCACEGDQRSAFAMLLSRRLCGCPSFMANPVRVDGANRKAVFAHCTVAPSLAKSYVIRSHYESGIGVGIQGILPEGPVALFKVGGPALDRYFISSGKILRNLDDPRCCRTQIEIELDEDPNYFLRSPLSNHHLIIPGDHARRIASFLDGEGLTRVR